MHKIALEKVTDCRAVIKALALATIALLTAGCKPPGSEDKLPAPTGITVAALSPTSIRISWSAPAGAEGCNLYRSDSGTGTFSRINASLVADSFSEVELPRFGGDV